MTKSQNSISKVLDCLQDQKKCFTELADLAGQQQKAIDDDDEARLLRTVTDKNPWIQFLQKADGEIIRILESMTPEEKETLSREADPLRTEINAALGTLIEKEERCAEALKGNKLQTDEQLREFKQRKQGLKGYGTTQKKRTRFSGNA